MTFVKCLCKLCTMQFFFFCTSALNLAQFIVAMMGKALPFKREDLAGLPEGM